MNTARQIFIDRYLVRPTVYLLNVMVRLAGKVLRLDHNLEKDFKTIAIAKYKGMGSIIQATPLVNALREKYPKAKIIFISSQANKQILQEISGVDELILLDDRSLLKIIVSLPRFILTMIRAKIEVFLDLEIYAHISAVFTTLSLATNRVGYHLRGSRYRLGIYTHMIYYNPKAPMSEVYLQMGRLLGISDRTYPLDNFEKSGKLEMGWEIDDYMVINVNASDLRLERRWSGEKFIALSKKLHSAFPRRRQVFIGSPAEESYTSDIVRELPFEVVNVAGKTTIAELIGIIKQAALMISNDTGPLHIAMAVKTPSVALFGPCSPTQYSIPDHVKVIYKNVYCSPCVHEFITPPCMGDNVCMQQIKVDDVITMLDPSHTVKHPLSILYSNDKDTLGVIKRS